MPPRDLSAAVGRFATLLRRSGLPVTLVEVTDAVRALDHLDITDRHELYLGLRALFVTRPEEVPPFDRCFEAFWRVLPDGDDDQSGFIPAPSLEDPGGAALAKQGQKKEALALESWGEEEAEEAGDPLSVPLASEAEGLVNQDFSTFSADQLDDLLKLTVKIARRLAHRMSRRRRPRKRRGRVDLRRTLRANLTRGDLIEPAHLPVFGPAPSTVVPASPANGVTIAPGMTVDEAEQKLIMATLESAGGNKTRAAEMLGISLKTLHNKLNRFKESGAEGA